MPTSTTRERLARVVLESDTRAGRVYNLVVFGAILLSVVGLLFEPAPGLASASSALVPAWVDWIDRLALAIFAADLVLHLIHIQREPVATWLADNHATILNVDT